MVGTSIRTESIGMIMESYISSELLGFPKTDLEMIKKAFLDIFEKVTIDDSDHEAIIELLKYDKKNEHGNINFVLLEQIGQPKIDCLVDNDVILKAFDYYKL